MMDGPIPGRMKRLDRIMRARPLLYQKTANQTGRRLSERLALVTREGIRLLLHQMAASAPVS